MRQPRRVAQTQYKYPHEVFTKLGEFNSFHDRVAYLKENQTFAIRTILQCNFTPHIQLDLPPGAPPFARDTLPPENSLGRIEKTIKILGKIAVFPSQPKAVGLGAIRNETLFIQLLEGVNEKDADIILAMKEKELTKMFPTLDETLVKTAFPDLFS